MSSVGTDQQDRGAGPYPLSGRVCELHGQSDGRTIVPEPVVVFEVLSPSTSRPTGSRSCGEYQATTSIQRYVILEQDSIAAWYSLATAMIGPVALTEADVLRMPEIGTELGLAEIYADVEFDDAATEPAA